MIIDPDEALVAAVGRGEPAAIRSFVAAKSQRMMALAGRMLGDAAEAEDVVQETFLRAWKQASGWRPGPAKFDTWMHRVALNLCYDRLRRRREIATDTPPERADESPSADAGMISGETARQVGEALGLLPDRQRQAIVLVHYQEMSNIDAAALMEVSVEALESLLSRGRRALRASLGYMRDV